MTAPAATATQRVVLSRDLDLVVWREGDLGECPDRFALVPRGAAAGAGPWPLDPDDLADIRAVSRATAEAETRRGTLRALGLAGMLAAAALAALLLAGPLRPTTLAHLATPTAPSAALPAAPPTPPPVATTAHAPAAPPQTREHPASPRAREPVSISAADWLRQRRGQADAQQGEN